jgi:hypothetical protein
MKHGLDMTGKVTVKENRICSKLESGLEEKECVVGRGFAARAVRGSDAVR